MTTTIALFNNKGGVGKTTLAYHLAHIVPRLGRVVLAVDLDPQANLTSAFFEEELLERIWDGAEGTTVLTAVEPILRGIGDIESPSPRAAAEDLGCCRATSASADSRTGSPTRGPRASSRTRQR